MNRKSTETNLNFAGNHFPVAQLGWTVNISGGISMLPLILLV